MGIARGLFHAVAGAVCLGVACLTPWQESANNLDEAQPLLGNISITPNGQPGPDATSASEQAPAPAGATPAADEPSPEVATLAPRTALGAPGKEGPLPADRSVLAQQLQRELTRVGCYEGEVSGIWTPNSRKAMKAFMDRVNAALPADEPDYILLSLVQGTQDKVCGMACPAGQGLADGRCLPSAILAGKKLPQPTRGAAPVVEPAPAIAVRSVARIPAASPTPSDAGRSGPAGSPAPRANGVADARPPGSGPNGQWPPAQGVPRSAEARRPTPQPAFGLGIIKQLEKMGF